MGSIEASFSSTPLPQPWVETPLIYSKALSAAAGWYVLVTYKYRHPLGAVLNTFNEQQDTFKTRF